MLFGKNWLSHIKLKKEPKKVLNSKKLLFDKWELVKNLDWSKRFFKELKKSGNKKSLKPLCMI